MDAPKLRVTEFESVRATGVWSVVRSVRLGVVLYDGSPILRARRSMSRTRYTTVSSPVYGSGLNMNPLVVDA